VLELKVLQNRSQKLWTFFSCFSTEHSDEIGQETNKYAKQFLNICKLPSRSIARSQKPVTKGEIFVALGLFMLIGIIEKPTLRSYFITKKGNFQT
jgi:hypothetical protein